MITGKAPALLVSFVFFKATQFAQIRGTLKYRDWVLDSGAYSAKTLGLAIDLDEYIRFCQEQKSIDPTLTEIYSLDVIGDWRKSLENTEAMWRAGVEAIPTYHVGEPEHALLAMARDYPKIALGGAVGYSKKIDWAEQCFQRVWPKRIHGLGFGSQKALMRVPFHSVDASNWERGPACFGHWRSFGELCVHGGQTTLRAEVDHYLRLEERAQHHWRASMQELGAVGPTVRLACASQRVGRTLS